MKSKAIIKTLLLPLLTTTLALSAQQQYKIEGRIKNLGDNARVFIVRGGAFVIDSALVKNDRFEFSGEVKNEKEASFARIIVGHDGKNPVNGNMKNRVDALDVYLVPGTTRIDGIDSIRQAKLSGTTFNEDKQNLNIALRPADKTRQTFTNLRRNASLVERNSEEYQHKYNALVKQYRDESRLIYTNFIAEHPKSIVSMIAIAENFDPQQSEEYYEVGKELYAMLDPSIRNSEKGLAYKETLLLVDRLSIGKPAPNFTQYDNNGKPISLSSFKGKYVLLDFWASWCGPCRAENRNLVKAYNEYKDKNFTVLGVSLDKESQRDAWLQAIKDDELNWTHVSDLKFWKNEAAALYGITAIPANFLIDPNGIIIAKNLGGEYLTDKLAELLN